MAEAVEGAAVVVPCVTSKYKASPNCLKVQPPLPRKIGTSLL